MIRKTIGMIMIFIGIYFIWVGAKYIIDSKIINDIRENGKVIHGIVINQNCDKNGNVTFKIEGEEINYRLDSDCNLFQVGDTVHFKTMSPYKKYIFVNESISPIAIIFSFSLGLILFILGLIILRQRKNYFHKSN